MARRRKHEHQLGDFWLGKRRDRSSWYIMWADRKSGRVERISTGTEDFGEAERQLAAHFQLRQGLHKARPDEVTLTVVAYRYYDQHGQHVRSRDEINRTIRYLTDFWPTESVSEITIQEQERFVQQLYDRGLSIGYVKRMVGVLGAAMRWAYNSNQLATVPAVLKPTYFGPDAERTRLLTLDEMAALWDAKMPDHLRVFLVLAINTVARPEALLELRRGQIDVEHRLLHLNPPGRTQTRKYRPTLPISNTLLPWLSMERDYQIQWKRNQDQPIGSIKKTWRTIRERAKLDSEVIPYTIRHTMATELRRRGVPEWECQGFMGHRSGGVTERYAKFQPGHLGAAVKAIDAYCEELNSITDTPIVLDAVPFTRQLRATRGAEDA